MDIAEYSFYLDFGDGWEDFSDRIILSDGYTPRICIGKGGAHEIQTVSLKIHRSAGLGARLAITDDPIPAKLLRGGVPVMIGIIRPFNSSKASLNRMEALSLSILDRSATLEQYVFDSKRWTNLTLINRADPETSLIHKLFMEAGVVDSADILVDFDRGEVIPCYALSNGEYISAMIQEALYEYGLTYRATAEGKFLIMDIAPDEITPALTIHNDDLRTEFSLVRSDSSRKGAVVRWYPILTRTQVPVYEYEFAGTAGSLPGGGVFPPLSDTQGYRLPYDISELTDGKLLAIANASVMYEPSSLQVSTHSEYGADDCSAYLRSTITSEQEVSVFRIIADIWYQGRSFSQQVVQGRNPRTYTAKVISDAGSAQRLARILSLRQTVGQQSYSFDSSRVLEPGQIVRIIEDQVSRLDVTVRILSCEFDAATGLYRYTAEGTQAIDLTIPVERIDALENALGKGRQGISIEDVDVEFYRSTSSSALVGGSWVTEAPAWVDGTYTWSRTKVSYSDKTTFSTEPVCITGSRGAVGPKGDKGDTGEAGPQGLQGLQGVKGDQGIQGPKGSDGLDSYNHIAYADNASGSGFSQIPSGKAYIGFYSDHMEADSSDPSRYAWSLIKGTDGSQGIPGPTGANGLTSYFHTAWANSADGVSGFSTTVSAGKLYIGAYSDHTQADSTDPQSYRWTLIKGEKGDQGVQGPQGIQGPAGANGQSLYTWIKYANDASGSGMADLPTGKSYIGIAYNKTTATKSSNAADYSWAKIEGAQGIPGPQGATGATLYTWLKYADSPTTGMSDSPTGKKYIGLAYNKSTQTESSTYSDYSWTLIKGETGAAGRGVSSIVEYYYQSTSATTQTGGSWTTSVPSWVEGKYIWTKSRITYTDSSYAESTPVCVTGAKGSTGSTGPKGDQGVPGSDGAAAQSFQIVSSTLAYPMSSRGVVIEDRTISLSCIKANIASSVAVSWSCSALGISSSSGATLALTIPSGTELVSIDVTCTVTGFTPQTIKLTGVKEGDERHVYLGVLSVATPQLADHFVKAGGRFVAQDYYLYSTAAGNYPKWYNGSEWVAVTEDTPNYSEICANTLADTLKQSGTVLSTSALYGFFQSLVSNDAFIKKLGAQIIKLLTGGKIESEEYVENVSGFQLRSDGTFNAVNANLINAIISGSGTFKGIIDSLPLKTTTQSEAGVPVLFDAKTHWYSDAMYAAVPLTESQNLQAVSGSYKGKAFTHATKLGSGVQAVLGSTSGSGTSYGAGQSEDGNRHDVTVPVAVMSLTVPAGASTIQYSVYCTFSGSSYPYPRCYVTRNGTQVANHAGLYKKQTVSGTISVSPGNTVVVYVRGSASYDSDFGWSYMNITGSGSMNALSALVGQGLFLKYTDNTFGLIGMGQYSNGLAMTGYTPVYPYAKATAFITGGSSYALNELKTASGTLVYNGQSYQVIGVMKTSAVAMTVFHENGSINFSLPDADPGTSGYYNASGSFAVIASVAGAEMMHVNAREADTYSIGNITRFLNIIGRNLIGENLNLGGMPAYGCRAWVNFNGMTNTGGYCTIRAAANVSSVTDNTTGVYTINFQSPMPDGNYAVSGAGMEANGLASGTTFQSAVSLGSINSILPNSVQVQNANVDANTNVDGAYITVAVFR